MLHPPKSTGYKFQKKLKKHLKKSLMLHPPKSTGYNNRNGYIVRPYLVVSNAPPAEVDGLLIKGLLCFILSESLMLHPPKSTGYLKGTNMHLKTEFASLMLHPPKSTGYNYRHSCS